MTTVKGIPGIGKTTLVKAAAYFLDEREAFKDGIILITMRRLDQVNMFLTRLHLIVDKYLPRMVGDKEDKASKLEPNVE